ncbi:MAG: hypothetical protein ACRDQF_07395, partial [Thermocrispum sp.]
MATGEQIYRWFTEGQIGPLQFAAMDIESLAEEFENDAGDLKRADEKMLEHWEGDSADQASKGIGPLIDGNRQSAPMLVDSGNSVNDQGQLLVDAKHSVEEVPPVPEEPSMWAKGASVLLPGVPDPEESYRAGMDRNEAANANNVRVMDQYGVGTGGTKGSLPSDFGIMEDDGAAIH